MNTYYIKSKVTENVNKNILEDLLVKRGNWIQYDKNKHNTLTFLYVDDEYIVTMPELYNMEANIKNLIDDNKKNITDKDKLYLNLCKLNQNVCTNHMMKQYQINMTNYKDIPTNIFDNNNVWIIKPVRGFKGTYNKIVTNYDDYLQYFYNSDKHPKFIKKYNYVMETYIQNPLLLDNKKFHIRVYYLYHNGHGYIWKFGKCIPTKVNYKNSDFSDTSIHDSHAYTNLPLILFPTDLTDLLGNNIDSIMEQLKEIFHNITKILKPTCYKDAKVTCYEIFGADIIITDTFQVKLLEINEKVGLGGIKDDQAYIDFYTKYFEGMLEVTIDKIIPSIHKQEINNYFIDVT